jgi:hypothetical protein
MPLIASDGIQVIDVTDFSIGISPAPLCLLMIVQTKLNGPARPV